MLRKSMSDVELKARKAAADFVNACFTDLESLDKVKDVYDDVYKVHETCRQQLDEHVILGFSFMLPYRLYFVLCRQRSYFVYDSCGLTLSRTGGRINICTYFVFKTRIAPQGNVWGRIWMWQKKWQWRCAGTLARNCVQACIIFSTYLCC